MPATTGVFLDAERAADVLNSAAEYGDTPSRLWRSPGPPNALFEGAIEDLSWHARRRLIGRCEKLSASLHGSSEELAQVLNSLTKELNLSVRVLRNEEETWVRVLLAPTDDPPTVMLAAIISALVERVCDDQRRRFRVCAASDCSRTFFDSTKNLSRRYCAGRGCAARTTTTNFRLRKRTKT
jgi:predicted RNA-binding Zn ribbon-like protein